MALCACSAMIISELRDNDNLLPFFYLRYLLNFSIVLILLRKRAGYWAVGPGGGRFLNSVLS